MTSARIGYARSYTPDEEVSLETLKRELLDAGCTMLFVEQWLPVEGAPQDKLEDAMDRLRQDDTLVVAKADRLCSLPAKLVETHRRVRAKGAFLAILNVGLDTKTVEGEMVLRILAELSANDPQPMPCRELKQIMTAKADEAHPAPKPKAKDLVREIRALRAEGYGATKIAKRLGINKSSVYLYWDEEE